LDATWEKTQRINSFRIEHRLLDAGDIARDFRDTADRFVGRGFVYAALEVNPRIDPGDVTRWRQLHLATSDGFSNFEPRIIKRGEGSVKSLTKASDAGDVQPVRRIENSEQVPIGFAKVD